MKVLMYILYTPSPLFETELEIIKKHEAAGDDILVLTCKGSAPVCHWNINHSPLFCSYCRSRFNNGIKVLKPGRNVQIEEFKIPLINKNLPSAKLHIDELKKWRWKESRLGLGIASSLISKNWRDHRLVLSTIPGKLKKEAQLSVGIFEALEKKIKEFNPNKIILFNGRISSATPAILLCEKYNIPYETYEVAGNQGKYLIRENSTPHSIPEAKKEIETLWNNGSSSKEEEAHAWFQERRKGVDQGIVSFTKNQKAGLLPDSFDTSKRNIVFFNSTIEEYAAIEGWENNLYTPDETAGVKEVLESFLDNPAFHFYLRVHPHMKHTQFSKNSQLQDIKKLSEEYRNLTVIWPEDIIHSYALIDACEKTITFGSTIGVEAAYWNKPSILLGRAFYEDFNCVYVPKTHVEAVELISKTDLPPLSSEDALKYGYREKSYGVPFIYYNQTGTEQGLFLGEKIKASVIAQFSFLLWRVFNKINFLISNKDR